MIQRGRTQVLVDTSVWVDHFRRGNSELVQLLEDGDVSTHPFVIGELACGNLANRTAILDLFQQLPAAQVASESEVLAMIERRRLMARGIGYVDAHVLAAAALTPFTRLWTLDKRLAKIAGELGLS
ncbi:MAG TPA: PIN domain-containing protein [Gemmatimonadaceae bacterium]|nr:PIN domain-containing protein [Gemmatimonadaceae bacterium]